MPEDKPVRAECQVTFAKFNENLTSIGSVLKEVNANLVDLKERSTRHDESLKGIWYEIRDGIKPDLKRIEGDISSSVKDHEEECLARRKFLKRVIDGKQDHSIQSEQTSFFPKMSPMVKIFVCSLLGVGIVLGGIIFMLVKLGLIPF